MWNKSQQDPETPQPLPESQPQPKSPPTPTTPASKTSADRPAVLGPSITIKGTLSGEEDLLIEGHVEGEVSFKKHAVTVGKKGRVDADLYCQSIIVEGEVNGNLYGEDVVVVRSSARVKGNAVAPRVGLEDGAQFQGSIDMKPKQPSAPPQKPVEQRAVESKSPENAGKSRPQEASSPK